MSHDQTAPAVRRDLEITPGPDNATTTPAEQTEAVGWHFHRWTVWAEGRVVSTFIDGSRTVTGVQYRKCTRCRKLKVRQHFRKVRAR